jgi:hypothetical protein
MCGRDQGSHADSASWEHSDWLALFPACRTASRPAKEPAYFANDGTNVTGLTLNRSNFLRGRSRREECAREA